MSDRDLRSPELDIVIPVYNEGENILPVLNSFKRHVQSSCRVLICYDRETDDTLPVVRLPPGHLWHSAGQKPR